MEKGHIFLTEEFSIKKCREDERNENHENTTVIFAAGQDTLMNDKISRQSFKEKQNNCTASKNFLSRYVT